MSGEIDVFEARRLQKEAKRCSHIGLRIKWWLFGMPESETLQQWLHRQKSPLTQEQEARVREVVREELQKMNNDGHAPADDNGE